MGIVIQAEGLAWKKDETHEITWYIQRAASSSVSLKQGGKQQEIWQTRHGYVLPYAVSSSILLYFTPRMTN